MSCPLPFRLHPLGSRFLLSSRWKTLPWNWEDVQSGRTCDFPSSQENFWRFSVPTAQGSPPCSKPFLDCSHSLPVALRCWAIQRDEVARRLAMSPSGGILRPMCVCVDAALYGLGWMAATGGFLCHSSNEARRARLRHASSRRLILLALPRMQIAPSVNSPVVSSNGC